MHVENLRSRDNVNGVWLYSYFLLYLRSPIRLDIMT